MNLGVDTKNAEVQNGDDLGNGDTNFQISK